MYLRIVRPVPHELEGYDVSRFRMLVAYEVAAPLCDLLVMHGYAVLDIRPTAAPDPRNMPKPSKR